MNKNEDIIFMDCDIETFKERVSTKPIHERFAILHKMMDFIQTRNDNTYMSIDISDSRVCNDITTIIYWHIKENMRSVILFQQYIDGKFIDV